MRTVSPIIVVLTCVRATGEGTVLSCFGHVNMYYVITLLWIRSLSL